MRTHRPQQSKLSPMQRTSLTVTAVLLSAMAGAILLGGAPSAEASHDVPGNRGWDSVSNRGWSQDVRDTSDLAGH
jgi:hypothetical protein